MQFINKYVEENVDHQPINCRNKMMWNIHNFKKNSGQHIMLCYVIMFKRINQRFAFPDARNRLSPEVSTAQNVNTLVWSVPPARSISLKMMKGMNIALRKYFLASFRSSGWLESILHTASATPNMALSASNSIKGTSLRHCWCRQEFDSWIPCCNLSMYCSYLQGSIAKQPPLGLCSFAL